MSCLNVKALVSTFNKMEALIGASSEHCETTGYMKLRWQLSFDTSADVIFSVAGSGGPRKPISHGELYHTFCLASTWLQGTSILRQFLKLYTLFVYLQTSDPSVSVPRHNEICNTLHKNNSCISGDLKRREAAPRVSTKMSWWIKFRSSFKMYLLVFVCRERHFNFCFLCVYIILNDY